MRRGVALYSQHIGRQATIEDLDDERVSAWLAALSNTHAAPTCAVHRTNLLTLWRDLADQGLCDHPGRVRRCPRPTPMPVAWTRHEMRRLIATTQLLTGNLPSGVPAALYCETLLRTGYDTGLRRCDLVAVEKAQIRPDGTIVLRQQKTGQPHQPRVRPRTLKLLGQITQDPPLACPYQSDSAFYQFWKTHVTGPAGVRHGAMQQLRRTGATHLAIDHDEDVTRYLGHRTAEMRRYYVDESIARPLANLPPDLG